ncbi:MAG: peptidylprolyl isomerase [Fimbriimonadaceae bacterium]
MVRPLLAALALSLLCLAIVGCDSKDPTVQAANDAKATAQPAASPSAPKGDVAVLVTSLGTIKIALLDNIAPKTVANFEKLADQKFYDGTAFHRVIPGFMIQGGDPNTKGADAASYGQGGPGYTIDDEFGDTNFVRGVVAMANTGQPNSGGSQFFIMVAPNPGLNTHYTAFGNVTDGMDVVDKLVKLKTSGDKVVDINGARIKSVTIIHAPGK